MCRSQSNDPLVQELNNQLNLQLLLELLQQLIIQLPYLEKTVQECEQMFFHHHLLSILLMEKTFQLELRHRDTSQVHKKEYYQKCYIPFHHLEYSFLWTWDVSLCLSSSWNVFSISRMDR